MIIEDREQHTLLEQHNTCKFAIFEVPKIHRRHTTFVISIVMGLNYTLGVSALRTIRGMHRMPHWQQSRACEASGLVLYHPLEEGRIHSTRVIW